MQKSSHGRTALQMVIAKDMARIKDMADGLESSEVRLWFWGETLSSIP
jgi:hypothetical protein